MKLPRIAQRRPARIIPWATIALAALIAMALTDQILH